MSGRGASKKDDGQIDSSKGKDKAIAPEAKVDAVPKPAAAGAASESTGKLKTPGETKPSSEPKPSDGPKQPGGAKHSRGDKLSGEGKGLGGSVPPGEPKQSGESKPTGGSVPSSDRTPAEEAKRSAGATRVGASTPAAEPKVTADTSDATKALGEPKHSRDLKPSRQPKVSEPSKPHSEPVIPSESKSTSDSKISGQPKPPIESKSPGKQKSTAELKSSREPKLTGDKKPIGEPKISSESKSSHESKPSSESKSRGSPDAAKESDKKKVERSDEHADKEKKTLKEETKGVSPKVDATAAIPKTSAAKERTSPTPKKATDQAKTKPEVTAAAKDSNGKVVGEKKGVTSLPASKTDGKVAEKLSSSKGTDLKLKETKADDGASSSVVGSTALKKDGKKDQLETAQSSEMKISTKKVTPTDEKKNVKATEPALKSVPVSEKKEPTLKRSPEKATGRPKVSADEVSPKDAKGSAEGVPKSKLNINGKECGKQPSVSKSPTQESLKKSPKDEKPKAASTRAPEKKSPPATTSPKQKKTQAEPLGKDSVLNINGKESGKPSSVSKSPTQESLHKSPKEEKTKAAVIRAPENSKESGKPSSVSKSPTQESLHKSPKEEKTKAAVIRAPEKKSPSASTSPKEKKLQSEPLGKDTVPKSLQADAAKSPMAVDEKKEESKDVKVKVIASPTVDKQDLKVSPQQETGKKKPEFPKLAIVDKTEVAKPPETKKSPSSLGERSLTQVAASKAGKSKTSPRTPEVKVVEFASPDTQRKGSTSDVQSPKGDEPDFAKQEFQETKPLLADSVPKDKKVSPTTSLKDSRDIKQEPTTDPQKLSARETALKGSSVDTLPTSAKATEEDKSISVSEPRLYKDPASKTSKPERSNGSDASKEPILHPIRRPSIPESMDPKSQRLTPQFSPASDGQKRFQFPPDPSKSIQSPSNKESPVQVRSPASPLDRSDSSCDSSLGRKPSSTRKTPGEHKTIVQMLQEAREEALPRGERKGSDLKEHSKSEMVLPGTQSNGSRREPVQQTSSPNLKAHNGVTFRTAEVKKGVPGKIDIKSTDAKEISKSEVVLPAASTPDAKMLPETEKQMTSSPNLTSVRGRHLSSVEGLPEPDSIARSSPSVAVLNGIHRPQRMSERSDSRKGSIISDTAGMPEQAGCRARSATWSQSVVPASVAAKREEESAASTDPEWDKRWSSAGSDLLAEKSLGRVPSKKGSIGPVSMSTGKEWRSEGIAKAVGTPFNGAAPKVGSTEHIRKSTEIARGSGDRRAWESEAGLVRHASSKGYTKFDNPSETKPLKNGSDLKRDIKDLVSPSSSTASKGSGIEKVSEASGSYHSVASSTHRRDSKSEAAPKEAPKHVEASTEEKQPESTMEIGDKVKLIEQEKGEEAMKEKTRQGFDVEIIVEMGGRERKGSRGSGKRSGKAREQHGVENQGADLERALQEEEEAAGTSSGKGQGVRLRPYIDLWENEDKFSVANSQLPLNPSGEEDAGSVGSMLTTEPERGNWTGRFDFILSLLGYSVGLGNVWRFPYLCYNNGGGAFLIPFTIMLVIAGLPLMFMELSFGQYANLGPAAIYAKFCPLFHGLGYGMVIVSTVVMLYYNLIIAWTIFYMFASLNKQLPWENCEPEWSTLDCYSYEIADDCMDKNGTYYQRTCYNETEAAASNITHLAEIAAKRPPAEEYFTNYVLGLSKGIEETGEIRFSMALCLLLAWAIVFLCLSKGVQSSGKVVYFTALFPYVVLIMLFIRGVTLPGASTGILFYLTPDWKRLANAQVWGDAAVQIFFALSPAWGGLITLASYNKFSNNCYKDSLIVAVSNILTSFFAGFVIFSVIGFLAHELNVEVKKVVDQGAGLAFIVYPEVVTRLPVSPVWSLLFFVMLLTLGLDSQFALMETVTTAILDRFPNLREKKVWVVLVVAVLGYFGGLIFTTNSGMYWLQLMDKYAANWSVLLIAISECILIAWVYGADRFLRDVQEMIGPKSRLWMFFWCWMWKLVTPATLLFILFFNWVEYAPASYGEYIYPLWADAAGWVIGVFPVLVILGAGVVKVYTAPEATLRERFKRLLQPTPDWGPTFKRTSAPPTYDSIKNTIVLMNGLPVIQETHADGESLEDNTL